MEAYKNNELNINNDSEIKQYDLDLVLLENLYNLYGIKDNSTSMNLLYHYLHIRAGIFYEKKNISRNELIQFIFQELNVDIFDNTEIYYHDAKYNINKIGDSFLENLEFRADFEGQINLKKIRDEIYTKGYKKAIKFRKSNYYKQHIQYNRLLELNNHFNIKPESKYDENFKKALSHNPFKRTLEEELLSYLDSEKIKSTTTQYIDEKALEDYLIKNLSLIEKDLIYQGRQIKVPGGIIDILAKDKDDNLVIIELKIDNDKSIIWQALHYPKVISEVKRINKEKIRMITIAPNYKKSILMRLQEIDNVEIYTYNIMVSLGQIEKLIINKVNN